MDYSIDYKPTLRELQAEVTSILNNAAYIKDRGISVLSEDILDIDYQIKSALSKQGLVIIVNTLQATYIGHDGLVNAWQIDNLEVDVVENPAVWRPYLKKHGFEDGTTTDLLHMMAEILGGPQSGIFGRFNPKSIEVGEDSALVVGKLKLQTTARQNVEGVVEEPTKVEIPFITKHELAELLAEVDYLKNLVEGFSTEEIKADISNLKDADTAIGERIDSLDDVYQLKGDYALKADLAPYALKSQIPVNTSQLNNDAGFIKEVYWGEVKDKPDVALKTDLPTKVSQLDNDSNFLTTVNWADIQGKPYIPDNIPTKTSELINDSGFITSVTWSDVQSKPNLVDEEKLNEATSDRPTFSQVDAAIDEKIAEIPKSDDAKRLWNDTRTQYISGSREVFGFQTIPAHYTEWQFSNGSNYSLRVVEKSDHTWCIQTNDSMYESKLSFATEEEAVEFLSTALEIEFIDDALVATRQYIEAQQVLVKIADLATTSQLPTKTSQLENDSGYLTSHQSLDGYATTEYVNKAISDEASARQAAVDTINSELLNKASKDEIPTKTSDLVNDSGYLTEHQSLENYATKQYVDERIPEEFPWDKISGKPDLVLKDQFDQSNKHIQDQIDQINTDIEGQVEVTKVYGQYKARYIDGDGNVFEKQEDGSYAQTGTLAKTSDLRTKTSELINDSGFITGVSWDEISQKPTIPTKLSELQNDEGYLKDVSWEQIQNKPDIATDTQLAEFKSEVDAKLDTKLDISEYDNTAIANSSKKIDANGDVYTREYTPSYYTPWTYSDGNSYADPLIYGDDATGWRLAIDQDTYRSQTYETQQQAQAALETALEIVFTRTDPVVQITATREYIVSTETWTKVDELALKSDIVTSSGISEEQCRTIVEGYGYQTQEQVNSAIDSKGFVTQSQVESQITSKGYQTQAQVQAIAAATLPTGYAETLVIGTLEDGTEVQFNILTKAIS